MDFLKSESNSLTDIKIPVSFNYLVVALWFALIYAPFDWYATANEVTFIQKTFNKIFFKFDLFQILSLIFLFYLFNFNRDKKSSQYSFPFFLSSILVIVIGLLNPNNSLTTGQYFYENSVFNFYYFLLISFAILYIEKELYIALFNRIFTIGLYILLIRSVQSLLLYFTGRGLLFSGGSPSTIPQMDVLIYLSAFQVLSLALFLNTKNKIYLIYVLIIFATLFFSYRRSALGLGLIADIFLMVYYLIATPQKTKAIQMFLVFFAALMVLSISFRMAMPKKFDDVFNRMAGAFSFFSNSTNNQNEYTDSGHMEQSIQTTQVFFSRINDTFWGAGFGNAAFFIEGQAEDGLEFNGGIHNSFVLAWAKWGLHVTIFLVFLILLMIRILIQILITKTSNFIVPGIIIFLMCLLVLGWSNGLLILEHLQYIIVFSLLFSIIRFLPQKNNSLL